VQARVLTVSEKSEGFGGEVVEQLRAAGVRVEKDLSSDKLGAKIRRAQLEKVPYMLVIGDKEVAARGVSPRSRDGKQAEMMPVEAFVRQVLDESHPSPSRP
jgi:threonyl-tRNA synthetase